MMTVNLTRWLKAKRNSGLHWLLGAAAAALIAGGCAGPEGPSKSQRLDDFLHAPEVLTGPSAVLLTNAHGFSARVEMTEQGKKKTGLLLGRESRLVFAQDLPKGSAKRHRYEQSSFIWDVSSNKGYVLNDPLQGYAPVAQLKKTLGQVASANSGASEDINGQHCRRVEKTISLSDGTTAVYTVWESSDLKGFPVRIKSLSGNFVVDFTMIRLEEVSAGLFLLPDGFLKFASPEAMTSELLEREILMKNKGAGEWNKTPVEFDPVGGNPARNNPYGPE